MSRTRTALLAAMALVAGATGTALAAVPGDRRRGRRPLHRGLQGAEPVGHRLHRVRDGHQPRRREVVVGGGMDLRRQPEGDQWLERQGHPVRRERHGVERGVQRHPRHGRLRHLRLPGQLQRHQRRPRHLHPRRRDLQRRLRRADRPAGPDRSAPGQPRRQPLRRRQGVREPRWSANAAAEPGGSRIANQPTGVWLDRTAAIEGAGGKMGLRDHLDEALEQKGSGGSSSSSSSTTCRAATVPPWPPTASSAPRRSTATRPSTSTRSRRSSPTPSTPRCGSSPRSRSTPCPTWSPTCRRGPPPRRTAT
ncbi:hypothetical protein SALBM217S_08373 [Streptomyces griseoloalbus]